jgi:hypothetical protein
MTDNLSSTSARPRPRLLASGALIAALAAACGSATSPTTAPGSTAAPTASPTSAPTQEGIAHPTGATDVILRMATTGGFAPIEFMATSAPSFTLYGDGTVVFRDATAVPPDPVGNVNRSVPFMTVRLGEGGIQALLAEAIGPGGLGIAAGPYVGMGADIPSTDFTITADGRTKQVSVVGLSPEMHPQNTQIVRLLMHLAERLDAFGKDIAGEQLYAPPSYRGVLMPVDQPFGPVVAWPWTTIKPTDFVKGDNEFFLTKTLTLADVQALGIPDPLGGFMGLSLKNDAKLYTFALRPLLPDETK